MPNYKQAPKLYHDKQKYKNINYYNLPQHLMDCIFQKLDGKCGNQIKLMTVLLGTLGDGSFGVSEKWICERTGMVQQTYNTARKALIERGWIYLKDGELYVLPDIIINGFPYREDDPTLTAAEKAKIREGTISHCVNAIKKQAPNDGKAQDDMVPRAQYDIVYNKIINRNNKSIGTSSPDGANGPILGNDFEIAGEISKSTADSIIEKQQVDNDIIYIPASGKYFKVRG